MNSAEQIPDSLRHIPTLGMVTHGIAYLRRARLLGAPLCSAKQRTFSTASAVIHLTGFKNATTLAT